MTKVLIAPQPPGSARRILAGLVVTLGACSRPAALPSVSLAAAGDAAEWPAYGHDAGGTRHSPATEINRNNVRDLRVAWQYRTGEAQKSFETARPTALQTTPIFVDGTLYFTTPLGRVIALDAERGIERWVFDPKIDRTVVYENFNNRGVATWVDESRAPGAPCRRRIFVAVIDGRLIALDARHGTPCADFGTGGSVSLLTDLVNDPAVAGESYVTSPPAIVGNRVIVGSAVRDSYRATAPHGVVRAFDVATGAPAWTWNPVPPSLETGGANAWSVMVADPQRDLVFVPTGSASPDYYGGLRPGDNKYANSIVALRASTGQVVWHFQVVHHDLWDYDIPSPPVLLSVVRDGIEIPAVAQATKIGHLFLFRRDTGEPLFPIEERPVPPSTIPGESAAPTQPFPVGIETLAPQRLEPADVWGINFWERRRCRKLVESLRNEGLFTPPSVQGTLVFPGYIGGAHWGGMASDPTRGLLVVNTNRLAVQVRLIPRDQATAKVLKEGKDVEIAPMHGTPYVLRREPVASPSRLPCNKPPFGTIAAFDPVTGKKRWEVALGTTRDLFRERIGIPIAKRWGTPNLGGPITTAAGLTFIAATMDYYLRAFDTETGAELWKGRLPAGGQATPMTYAVASSGRQYVVVAAGGHPRLGTKTGDYLVAFALRADAASH